MKFLVLAIILISIANIKSWEYCQYYKDTNCTGLLNEEWMKSSCDPNTTDSFPNATLDSSLKATNNNTSIMLKFINKSGLKLDFF